MSDVPTSSLVNSTKFGADVVVQERGALVTDIYGLSTVTTVLKIVYGQEGQIPTMFSLHPDYPYVALERRRVEHQSGFLIVTCDYAGVNGTSLPIYEMTIGVQDEPIVSHPNFIAGIGGRPSAPLNGAVFIGPDGAITRDDSVGQFAYFSVGSALAGVESYLAADFLTVRQRYCTSGVIVGTDLGHLSAPPWAPISPSNWIKISTNVEQRGISYMVCHEWRAGGRRGWNSLIYG